MADQSAGSPKRFPLHLIAFLATIGAAWALFRSVGGPPPAATAPPPVRKAVATPAVTPTPTVALTAPHHLQFGDPSARVWMRSGWSVDESGGSESYVWSDGPSSLLELPLPDDADLHVSFSGKPYGSGKPAQKVSVVLNGQVIQAVPLQAGKHTYAVALPPTAIRPGSNALEFRYAYTRKPSEVEPGSQDTRQLAVSWYSIDFLTAVSHIQFGDPSARASMRAGWSRDEKQGTNTYVWSDGPSSKLELLLPTGSDLRLDFKCQPYVYPGHPAQTVTVVLNGTTVKKVAIAEGANGYSVILPKAAIRAASNALEFVYGYAERPEVVEKPSSDTRQLGVAWHSIDVTPVQK